MASPECQTDWISSTLIVPWGLTGKPVTSMERELQKSPAVDEVATAASRNFGRVFQSQILWLESLDDLLAEGPPSRKKLLLHPSPKRQ